MASAPMLLTAAIAAFLALGGVLYRPLNWLFLLPGTLAHELAHWLVAFLTGSRPGLPRLIPHRMDCGTWSLGSVSFAPGWLTAGFVAMAPAYLLPILAVALYAYGSGQSLPVQGGVGYVLGVLAWSWWPSRTDFRIAARYPVGTLVLVGILGLLLLGVWDRIELPTP